MVTDRRAGTPGTTCCRVKEDDMATVKICTVAGQCIRCAKTTSGDISTELERLESEGKKYFCCGNQCVRIDQIGTITEEVKLPPDDDDDGGIIVGNPDVVIITGRQPILKS
jgi:hypothetical protein